MIACKQCGCSSSVIVSALCPECWDIACLARLECNQSQGWLANVFALLDQAVASDREQGLWEGELFQKLHQQHLDELDGYRHAIIRAPQAL